MNSAAIRQTPFDNGFQTGPRINPFQRVFHSLRLGFKPMPVCNRGDITTMTDDIQATLQRELRRSQPDYIVYVPKSIDGSTFDTGNEHFLVTDAPDGALMAVWTQSTARGRGRPPHHVLPVGG